MAQDERQMSGVAELIARLRDEGVQSGKQEAERIIRDAEEKALTIVSDANTKAQETMSNAKEEIESARKAAKEALKVAIRDTSLEMEADLKSAFTAHVKHLVSMELQDKEFLRELILLIAGRSVEGVAEGKKVQVRVPPQWFTVDEKGAQLTAEGKERAKHCVLGISGDMLREGVELQPGEDHTFGITVRLKGEDVEIDLSENAISGFLLKYLLPRFRSIVEGME